MTIHFYNLWRDWNPRCGFIDHEFKLINIKYSRRREESGGYPSLSPHYPHQLFLALLNFEVVVRWK